MTSVDELLVLRLVILYTWLQVLNSNHHNLTNVYRNNSNSVHLIKKLLY